MTTIALRINFLHGLLFTRMTAGKRLFFIWLIAFAGLGIATTLIIGRALPGLVIALALLAWDISLGSFIVRLALSARRDQSGTHRQPISVLIAAYNEAPSVAATLTSVLAQAGVRYEILLGDDGSSDSTFATAARASAADPRVRIVRQTHAGKAAMLNRLLAQARFPLVVTLDADSELRPGALAALSARFSSAAVEAAAARVLIRRPHHLLTRFQSTEYIRNNFVREAWARLGALEQVPGACAAFRTEALRAVGGFPTNSLTEDYEVVYRLYARAAAERRTIAIAFVPEAVALTDGPPHLRGFARQRTRWFAGFLTTLVRFRALIFNRRAGIFGLVKLPLKVIDAVIPLTSLFFLALVAFGATSRDARVAHFSWMLFALRWLWDAGCYAVLLRAEEKREPLPDRGWAWACALGEALSYAWLRYVVMLAAYPQALRRAEGWEPPRSVIINEVMHSSAISAYGQREERS